MEELETQITAVQGVTLCCRRCESRKFFVYVQPKAKCVATNYICSECGDITLSEDDGVIVESKDD